MSDGTNDNTIVLDLNNLDFESDISGNNIWQKDAVNEFTRFYQKQRRKLKSVNEIEKSVIPQSFMMLFLLAVLVVQVKLSFYKILKGFGRIL